ncbi:hypothetical protein HL653_02595 [Sphingomonas sp. AP4-R1]|uniref:hypothetical protein n=1 Tax=Sphingomonas sp. AP4-R1 TaxID=2735134 RepID=UPI001493C41F|nr:hypothetical protein [Sphingomonas sp. AP4-R1]QJU56823.1 hypothetical protein HL653_02595 [Sphingomonas sp. AP4-R1]
MVADAVSREIFDMVGAAFQASDRFGAGRLLGAATLDRVRATGEQALIKRTYEALQIVAAPARDELTDGFAKAIFFGVYVEPGSRFSSASI